MARAAVNRKTLSPATRLKRLPMLLLSLWAPAAGAAEEAPTEPVREEPGVLGRPRPEGVPALQMSTDYAHPALGFGTYAPVSQVAARGVRVEPFTILAGIQAGMGYDDNVALSSTRKVGSFFATVSPSVAVGLDGANHRYYVAYRGHYGTYATNAQDDYADHNIVLTATDSWTTRFRTAASYDYIKGHTPRGLTATSVTSAERWSQHSLRGTANYGAAGAQGGLQGDLGYTSRRYATGAVAGTAEYDRFDIGGTFFYRVAPKTRAFANVVRSDVEHPGNPALDSEEMRYSVGATWEALATTTGRLGAGYATKDFAGPALNDFSGYIFDAGVTWSPQIQSTFDFGASRFLSETFEVGTAFLVNTVGSASWNQAWPRSIRSTVNYSHGNVEHQGAGRTDKYQTFGARVSYALSRSLRVGVEYRFDGRSSSASNFDYSRNLYLLTAEAAF